MIMWTVFILFLDTTLSAFTGIPCKNHLFDICPGILFHGHFKPKKPKTPSLQTTGMKRQNRLYFKDTIEFCLHF